MLRLAVSSKVLLDMSEMCILYQSQGKTAFELEMEQRAKDPLPLSATAPLIQALQRTGLVEISLISKMGYKASERISRSLDAHGLRIETQIFSDGPGAYKYAGPECCNVHAYLACNDDDVKAALDQGIPAARVLNTSQPNLEPIQEIRIAIDWDGFTASDESEQLFITGGLPAFMKNEHDKQDEPMNPGPFKNFVCALSDMRKKLLEQNAEMKMRLAIVTSRGAPSHYRVLKTLKAWNIDVDQTLFLSGRNKAGFVKEFGAQLFFDDQRKHCEAVSRYVTSAHAIAGAANKKFISQATRAPLRFTPAEPDPKRAKPDEKCDILPACTH